MEDLLEHNVSFYSATPSGIENLHEQLHAALERLELYNIFENSDFYIGIEDLRKRLLESKLCYLLDSDDSEEVRLARKSDYCSHWILKVAFSETHSLLFIKHELKWFQLRFYSMSDSQKSQFLEKFELTETIKNSELCYKLKYNEVKKLLVRRLYPMELGYIYIPKNKIVHWLLDKFEAELFHSLVHVKKMLPSICDQLTTMISMLDLQRPLEVKTGNLSLENLQQEMKKFPLCMQNQLAVLQKNHHLKYHSRVQLGLFLKTCGLSLDEALQLWKNEFTKIMTEQKFNQEYLYFFKHQYGTVGGKIDYKGLDCSKILKTPVEFDQPHGCPFQKWSSSYMEQKLKKMGFSQFSIENIMKSKRNGSFQKSCALYFSTCFNCKLPDVIKHPNCYYETASNIIDIEDIYKSDSD